MTSGDVPMEALAAEIGTALLADDPDLQDLARRVGEKGALATADAESLIYHVTAELNARFFPPITKVELILSEGCNLACEYCFEKHVTGARNMPAAVARGAIDLLVEYSREEKEINITHFGGEPLLNLPTLFAATEYAEERAAATGKTVSFNITTNGLLLDDELAGRLARHGIKALLSIDGGATSHDRYRKDRSGRGTFHRAMAALKLLKKHQQWVGAKVTVMPENVHRLYEDVLELYDFGVNQFLIGHASGIPWSDHDIALYQEQMGRLYDWYRQGHRNDLRISEFEGEAGPVPRFGCQAGRDTISVSPGGEISSCSKVLALNNTKLVAKLGDVRHGLTHLVNRGQVVECGRLRSACNELGIAEEFAGGCLAANYEENGDLFKPSLQDHAISLLKRNWLAFQHDLQQGNGSDTRQEVRP
jgi:uncharacterized protein